MMTAINGAMLAAGSSPAALIVVKVTVVAALGLAAAWLARRSRAAVRHAVLAATFGAILLLPIASIVVPTVHVAVPVAEVSRAARPLVVNTTAPIPPVTTAADGARLASVAPQQSSTFSLSVLLLAGWIVGTAVFLVPVVTGLWQIRSVRRCGVPWLDGQSIAETLALDAGIHRRVEVLLHEALPGPIACGVLGPAIVLPREAESWAREDLSRAIVHELEHVRRGDSGTRCLARTACALYWFHPLAWIAWRKLVLEAERSCDDAVLRRSEATAYADQLVGLAKRLPTAQRSPLLAMASRSDLSVRVGSLLDGRQRRGRVGAFSLAMACAGAVLLVIVMSPLTIVAAPQAQARPTFEVATPAKLEFEVASVRGGRSLLGEGTDTPFAKGAPIPAAGIVSGGPGTSDPERLTYTHVMMRKILMDAFELDQDQFAGPSWVFDSTDVFDSTTPFRGDRYDINAKVPPGTTKEQVRLMLQNLLETRFSLAFHYEKRDFDVYALVVAKNGPKLKRAEEAKAPTPDDEPGGIRPPPVLGDDGFPQLPPGIPRFSGRGQDGRTRMTARMQTAADITRLVGSLIRNDHIVDKTGLTGKYDFKIEFAGGPRVASSDNVPGDPVEDFPTALEKQLGLKLEKSKAPLDVLVIDHIDKLPTEN